MPKKGYKQTEEHKRNLREYYQNHPEARQRRSEAKKGKTPWNKGLTKETDERVIISETTREKMSKSHKELWERPGEREKMSKRISGKNHPMYGKPGVNLGKYFSEDTKKKMSIAQKEVWERPESIERRRSENNPNYGNRWSWTEEQKEKKRGKNNPMYGVHRIGKDAPFYGKHHTPETIENRTGKNNYNYGKHIPEKQKQRQIKTVNEYWNKPGMREKAREKSKAVWERPGYRENMIKIHSGENSCWYGKHLSEKHRKSIGDGNRGKKRSLEAKRKYSKAKKELFAIPENRKKDSINKIEFYKNHPETIELIKKARAKQVIPVKDTKIEVKIQDLLRQLGFDFFTHQYMKIEHGYQCDVLIPSLNLVIECDGDYWHKFPIGNDIDHIRTKELLEKGFKVLRLWEREINELDLKGFEDIIIKLK